MTRRRAQVALLLLALSACGTGGGDGSDGSVGRGGGDGSIGSDGSDGSDGSVRRDGGDGGDGGVGSDGGVGRDGSVGRDGGDGGDGSDGGDGGDGRVGSVRLSIAVNGSGSTSPSAGTHLQGLGTTIQVKAVPASGATFTGWSGAATGANNPAAITMDGDKTLTAHFSGKEPLSPISVFLAGDSTVSNYDANHRPQAGWGQMLPELLTSQAKVVNGAVGGRTSRRFIFEGRLDDILKVIKPGDYLLLQFGTNDGNKTATYSDGMPYYLAPEDFKTYIAQYVTAARERQAIPVLVTPPPRRTCDASNDSKPFGNGTGAYATAMKEVGEKMGAAVVDLNQKTLDYLNSIGCAASAQVFLVVPAGMYTGAYANGVSDGTHFQEAGARKLAGFVADGVRALDLSLAAYLK